MTKKRKKCGHEIYATRHVIDAARAGARLSFFRHLVSSMPARDTPASPKKQSMISSFFPQSPTSQTKSSKRRTVSSDERPPKRPRTTQQHLFLPGSPVPESDLGPNSQQQAGLTSQWRYRSRSPSETLPEPSNEEQRARDNLRARLSKTLVIENNTSRKEGALADYDGSDKEETDEEDQSSASSGSESDDQFKALQKMFAHSSKSKRNSKSAAGRKTKKVRGKTGEIGPSGKTYTPLEQQVRIMCTCYVLPAHPQAL